MGTNWADEIVALGRDSDDNVSHDMCSATVAVCAKPGLTNEPATAILTAKRTTTAARQWSPAPNADVIGRARIIASRRACPE